MQNRGWGGERVNSAHTEGSVWSAEPWAEFAVDTNGNPERFPVIAVPYGYDPMCRRKSHMSNETTTKFHRDIASIIHSNYEFFAVLRRTSEFKTRESLLGFLSVRLDETQLKGKNLLCLIMHEYSRSSTTGT
jgi:hypothetical protein